MISIDDTRDMVISYLQLEDELFELYTLTANAKYYWIDTKVRYVYVPDTLDEETIYFSDYIENNVLTKIYHSYVHSVNMPNSFTNQDTNEISYVSRVQLYPSELFDNCQKYYDELKFHCNNDIINDIIWSSYLEVVDYILNHVKSVQLVDYEAYVQSNYDKRVFQFKQLTGITCPLWLHSWTNQYSHLDTSSLATLQILIQHVFEYYSETEEEYLAAEEDSNQISIFDDQAVPEYHQQLLDEEEVEQDYYDFLNTVYENTHYDSYESSDTDQE